jgi:hypothetical protein
MLLLLQDRNVAADAAVVCTTPHAANGSVCHHIEKHKGPKKEAILAEPGYVHIKGSGGFLKK